MAKMRQSVTYICLVLFALTLTYTHYQLNRTDHPALVLLYSFAFLGYFFLVKKGNLRFHHILWASIGCRLLLFGAPPGLSDDVYRFIWDGRLLAHGINPFAYTPEYLMHLQVRWDFLPTELYQQLNSPTYHTVYPPVSQGIYSVAAALFPNSIFGSITFIRSIILLAEIGSIMLLGSLLKLSGQAASRVGWYALNPLVILELTGNLHFEGIMLFFVLLFVYLYKKDAPYQAAIPLGLSIATKLIPLIFLPVMLKKMMPGKLLLFYLIAGGVTAITFLPFVSPSLIEGMSSSLGLFFQSFEFNGGIFFLIREIGLYTKGYDMVSSIGPWLNLTAFMLIIGYSLTSRKHTPLASGFIVVLGIQLSLATTVHPWYIIPLVAFASLTPYRFPVVWSFLIFFTYVGYSTAGYEHPLGLIAVEYLIVLPMALVEIMKYRKLTKYV
jgi:hypothetical protein